MLLYKKFVWGVDALRLSPLRYLFRNLFFRQFHAVRKHSDHQRCNTAAEGRVDALCLSTKLLTQTPSALLYPVTGNPNRSDTSL